MQRLHACTRLNFNSVNHFVLRSAAVNISTVTEKVKQTPCLKSYKEIPGPRSWPFIGAILDFLPGGKLAGYKGVKLSDRLYKLYGPIVKVGGSFGGYDSVFVFDPEAVEIVYRSEDMMPIRPGLQSLEYYRKRYNKIYDPKRITGLSSDQGDEWKDLRLKVSPILLQPKTVQLYTDVLEEISNDMIKRLRSIRDENNKLTKKISDEMNLWSLESLGMVMLGTRLNCFDPNLPADSPTRKLIQIIHDIFVISDKLDHSPSLWRLYSTPMFKKAMYTYEQHESIVKYYLDQAIKKLEESKKNSSETTNVAKSILEKFLEIDVRIAEMMLPDMLFGGIDTVAHTVIGTLYLLAINPEKQNKLREEVLAKQAGKSYLKACIKESMRMLPVTNANVRLSTKKYNLLGYNTPNNILIVCCHQYMSIMGEHYPKSDEFIPERWLADKVDPLYRGNTHPLVMAPFGFGTRMCIGHRIAALEIESIITKVMENFHIEWTSEEPIKISHTLFNYYIEPYDFVFKDV